jgi:hypothetical protein
MVFTTRVADFCLNLTDNDKEFEYHYNNLLLRTFNDMQKIFFKMFKWILNMCYIPPTKDMATRLNSCREH